MPDNCALAVSCSQCRRRRAAGPFFENPPDIVGIELAAQRQLTGQGDDLLPAGVDDHRRFGLRRI
jgi:hypothetical protein